MRNEKVYEKYPKEILIKIILNSLEDKDKAEKEAKYLYKKITELVDELKQNRKVNRENGYQNVIDIDYLLERLGW